MLNGLMNFLDNICMTVTGAAKGLLDTYGNLFWGIAKLFGPIGMIANEVCMAFVNAGKGLVDVYGNVVYGITGAISGLGQGLGGNLAKGVAISGAIAVGGWAASGSASIQPTGPLLGQPAAPAITASAPSATPSATPVADEPAAEPITSSLPVVQQSPATLASSQDFVIQLPGGYVIRGTAPAGSQLSGGLQQPVTL